MKPTYKLISSCLLLITSIVAIAQDNSPWKNFPSQTVSGVLAAPGSHAYSLTGGQGFAVYLRNDNTYPVNVSGLLSAKTICGTYVSSKFTATLEPGQIASGSDYDKGTQNGLTSVVTVANCLGAKYAKIPKYINRISAVTISDVRVTQLASSQLPSIKETIIPTPVAPKFDSLGFYKSQWGYTKDSLLNEINSLKYKNKSLVDTANSKATLFSNLLSTQQPATMPATLKKKESSAVPYTIALQAGLGYDVLPIITNNNLPTPQQNAYTRSTSHPLVQLGLLVKLFNNSPINLELTPFATYGRSLLNGESGNYISYGIGASALIPLGETIPLKVVVTGNFTARNGTWSRDIRDADYSYTFLRYGGGLRYMGKNFWIQPGVYLDNPSSKISGTSGTSPSIVPTIDAEIANKWHVTVSYGSDYFNQGTLKYPAAFSIRKEDYYAIRLLYNFSLSK